MSGLDKIGYLLIGVGVGIFGASVVYARELDKPVGEIEEYIPLEDREDDISNNSKNDGTDPETGDGGEGTDISDKERDRLEKIRRYREITEGHYNRSRNGSSDNREFQADQSEVLNFYKDPSRNAEGSLDKKSFERDGKKLSGRSQKENKGRRYSQMYKNSVTDSDGYREPVDSSALRDHPDDDMYDEYEPEVDLHEEYNLETIEPGFEVFLDDNPQDFVTVIFYEGDTTLCDDGEQIIPNPEEVVGMAALQRLIDGGPGAENNVIFVHNMKTHINYEVVLDAGMYQDTVLGLFESRLNEEADKGGVSR